MRLLNQSNKTLIFLLLVLCANISRAFSQFTVHLPDLVIEYSGIIQPNKDLKINEIMASNLSVLKDEYGEYDDWIELYNYSDDTINLKGLYISDSRSNLTKFQVSADTLVPPKNFVILWADEECSQGVLHTSFKLSGEGEQIYLCDEALIVLDSIEFQAQTANISFGRLKNDFLSWNYFVEPSPGKENPVSGLLQVIDPPAANYLSGYYNAPICFEMIHHDEGVIIRYTLNGDTPVETSAEYTDCIALDTTTIVRYRSFKNNCIPSITQTRTFFFEETDEDLDVVFIAINESDLYGPLGIFSSRNKEIEKPVHIEYFGNDRKMKFNIDGGIRLHKPKQNKQLSLCLFARSDYGFDEMNYQIFQNKNIHSFNRLILRNGGNDGTALKRPSLTHFRDGLHHILFEQTGNKSATSAYRPVNVYINGKYFGIYNAREKIDRDFIEANYGFRGRFDLLERAFDYSGNRYAIEGSFQLYDSVTSFINNNDISIEENYNLVAGFINIDNFIDYWIHEIYIGNFDWMCNNIKIYRPDTENGKFNWILWDTDHGSGLPYKGYEKPEWRTLQWSLSIDQPRTSGGVDNIMHRNLIKNEKFRVHFINRYADLLNTVYGYNNTASVIDSISGMLQNDMVHHCLRWNVNLDSWKAAVDNMKKYHALRPVYVRTDIMNYFNLEDTCLVTLKTNDQNAGIVKINTISPIYDNNEWKGIYFSGIPVSLEAIPNKGYKFEGWKNTSFSDSTFQTVCLTNDSLFEAVFSFAPIDSLKIIINEISYANPENSLTGDWIEIVNLSGVNRSLKNWKLVIDAQTYVFEDIEVENNEHLLVASIEKGVSLKVNSEIVHFNNFDLENSGCHIKLTDPTNRIIDEVEFNNTLPWPILAGGNEFTLELISPDSDNSLYSMWRGSIFIGGTPGQQNTLRSDDLNYITINEFMAENDGGWLYDEFWENDDWIELYNKSDKEIDVRSLFITDNADHPTKYQIPNTREAINIDPLGFLILWADGDIEQGPLHSNFSLKAEGEEIVISQNTGYEILEIDRIKFGPQSGFYSYGKEYDGVGSQNNNWVVLSPSPGKNNERPTITNSENIGDAYSDSDFLVYPVPATNDLYIQSAYGAKSRQLSIEVINIIGVKQDISLQCYDESLIKVNLTNLQPGLYIIRISDEEGNQYTRKIIKSY